MTLTFRPPQRLANIKESTIREMTRLAHEYKAVNMAQGFPEFQPAPPIAAAAKAAIDNGINQYAITWGSHELRGALADKYGRFYNMDVDPLTDVTVTCGVTEAVMATLLGIIDPGDKVIVLEPAHENYAPGIYWAGGEPIWVPMAPPDFELDVAMLEAAFAQKPKAIILNTPQNPTGRVLDATLLGHIARLCVTHDVIAITDEIYEHIVYAGHTHIPLATLPGMAGRTITISGLGKTYAVTGWRVGWIVAPALLSKSIRPVHDFLTICAPSPLQAAAVVAVNLPDSFYTELVATYTGCRDRTMQILRDAGFYAQTPEGAYYVLADFRQLQPDMDDVAFTRWLITEKQVAVVPGGSFYHDASLGQHVVRFAFPKLMSTLDAVGQRLIR